MTRSAILDVPKNGGSVAEQNRQALHGAGVVTVNVVGGPGCGKTTLLDQAIVRLTPKLRIGVIAGDLWTHRDIDRMSLHTKQVVQVNTWGAPCLDPSHVRDALHDLDLEQLDLLFIENVGSLTVPTTGQDLGQDATVTVFSVAAGDDKAQKHSDLVAAADAVVLNKIDLLPAIPFDLAAFRADVRRINPSAELMEISALSKRGLTPWLNWLLHWVSKKPSPCHDASHWFG